MIIQARLESVSPRELRLKLGLKPGELGLLAGGPPCQPFTTHGLRLAITDARAASVFPHYLDFVKEFSPSAVVMENVDGMLSAALRHRPLALRTKDRPMLPDEMKGSFLRWLTFEFVRIGYSVSWGVAEAADHGVPQFRQRAILIAVRDASPCFLPGCTQHFSYLTLRDALNGLTDPGPVQPLSARKRTIYGLIPPGGIGGTCLPSFRSRPWGGPTTPRAAEAAGGAGSPGTSRLRPYSACRTIPARA